MKALTTGLAVVALLFSGGLLAQTDDAYEGDAKDAWLTGKVETVFLLNRHLNNFRIDTDVLDGTVRLTGAVESDIDRELAGALAAGVEGVVEVENELTVEADRGDTARGESEAGRETEAELREAETVVRETDGVRQGRTFGTWVDDATTTAVIKSKLLGNGETEGLEIDVDTHENIVTLSGRVDSDDVKQLAEQLAMNTNDVRDVRNNLVVDPE